MTPNQRDGNDKPDWTETINGDVKTNGKLHIWSTENATAVITSDHYVRPGHDAVTVPRRCQNRPRFHGCLAQLGQSSALQMRDTRGFKSFSIHSRSSHYRDVPGTPDRSVQQLRAGHGPAAKNNNVSGLG